MKKIIPIENRDEEEPADKYSTKNPVHKTDKSHTRYRIMYHLKFSM